MANLTRGARSKRKHVALCPEVVEYRLEAARHHPPPISCTSIASAPGAAASKSGGKRRLPVRADGLSTGPASERIHAK